MLTSVNIIQSIKFVLKALSNMNREELNPQELINFLIRHSNLNVTQLAKELKLSRQTLNNWRQGITSRFDPDTIQKLAKTLENNNWGLKLGNISNSTVEIIHVKEQSVSYGGSVGSINSGGNNNKEKINELNQIIVNLTKENMNLRNDVEFLRNEIDSLTTKLKFLEKK